jgi:hypothetical protein
MKSALIKLLATQRPLRVTLARRVIERFSLFSYQDRLRLCAIDRPHYGHCIFEAVQLANRLGYPNISVVEFGCGGGNGLLNAEMHIAEVSKVFPNVHVELYGFDMGTGLPPPLKDYRDFPHYFRPGQYVMDPVMVQKKLNIGKLVLGNVKDTCKTFFTDFNPAPIGCIFHDLDFYSSTSDSFTLFEADGKHFLPRVFMYFDDIIGDDTWLANEYAGEMLAIEEFNQAHSLKKIAKNLAVPRDFPDQSWKDQIYIYHDFAHPEYNEFVAKDEQVEHEASIRLRINKLNMKRQRFA